MVLEKMSQERKLETLRWQSILLQGLTPLSSCLDYSFMEDHSTFR